MKEIAYLISHYIEDFIIFSMYCIFKKKINFRVFGIYLWVILERHINN